MNEVVRNTQKKIDKFLKDREVELESLSEKIEAQKKFMNEARRDLDEAVLEGNEEKYKESKRKYKDAAALIEMYSKKMKLVENNKLVTREENEEVMGSLKHQHEVLVSETIGSLIPLVKQIDELRKSFLDTQTAINDVAMKWHGKVYKQMKEIGKEGGKPILMETDPRMYDKDLAFFMEGICENHYCKKNGILEVEE